MGKFDSVKKDIKNVANKSNEKANLITIKYYKDEDLLDYPNNNEDVSNTGDIEISIAENGFTDPIEITDFGCEEGKFTILSGHRRRMAGRRFGLKEFPCILRHFKSDAEVYNYVLMSNAQRDSAKDPLLLARRYLGHETYLKNIGFKGKLREEIAKRMGLKPAQADRYKHMNDAIIPLRDMVASGILGMSSITDTGLYAESEENQTEILQILNDYLESEKKNLNRDTVSSIVKAYRNGMKSWNDIKNSQKISEPLPVFDGASDTATSVMNVSDEPTGSGVHEPSPLDRNNEVDYDYSHRDDLPLPSGDSFDNERLTKDDFDAIDKKNENDKNEEEKRKEPLTEEEKRIKLGKAINDKVLSLYSTIDGEYYDFENEEEKLLAFKNMTSLAIRIIDDIGISMEEDVNISKDKVESELKKIHQTLLAYIGN